MSRRCAICDHASKASIELELLSKKDTQEIIAARYATTRRSLAAHLKNHMAGAARKLERPLKLTGEPRSDALAILQECARILNDARGAGIDLQIKAADAAAKKVELVARLFGDMPPDTQIQILQVIVQDGSKTGQIESRRPDQLLLGS